ncbi:hypothetical protein ACFQZS_17200 [Mucilaginibacter calamicampi]|uniref:Uncharacterized protein n=1 Tax=Mucilaginibacter calamicampi TaxID=1302352 RepID=A0ABW2Z099_9SPHI
MVSITDLRKAHYISAKLVEKFGPDYLIFFERVDKELIEAEKKQDLMKVALEIANHPNN